MFKRIKKSFVSECHRINPLRLLGISLIFPVLALIMVLSQFPRDANAGTTWAKTYGRTDYYDKAFSVCQTADGGYIAAGLTKHSSAARDVWILKSDSGGEVEWEKSYGGSGEDYPDCIQQTSDGGYIVAGSTNSFDGSLYDFWVLKLDGSGNVLWQNTYGGTGFEYAYGIEETSDGGFIVGGYTTSFGAVGRDFWILELDSGGNVTWQNTYGDTNNEEVYDIHETSDNGFIVAVYTASAGAGSDDFWILKLNSN